MVKRPHNLTDVDGKPVLWVVSELYYPELTSTGYYLTKIAEGLTDKFTVKVLCGQPNYSARGTKAPSRESRNGVEIFRVAGTTLNKNVILFRIINMLTLSFSTWFRAIRSFGPGDQVLVVTNPPLMPFVIAVASLLRGAQYTLLIHDNYPEILIAVGKIKAASGFANLSNFANRWLYKHSAKLIGVGRDMKILLEAKSAGLDVPIAVIQNWAELESVEPRERVKNKMLADLNLSDKFVLLYAGNLGHPNDLETIVECAELLRDNDKIAFVFVGSGAKEGWLRDAIQAKKLDNMTLLPPRPRSEQIDFLNACDVGIVSLVSKMCGVSMPSRTYNILAAGKPILAITDRASELAIVIDEDRVGWHVPPGDAHALKDLILRISSGQEDLAAIGKRARRSALDKYSLETALDKYRAAFDS